MTDNSGLTGAKKAKQDEFYTDYGDIEKELKHYKGHFKDATVFCNCDDPYESNFTMFFIKKAQEYGIRRLICVCYGRSQVAGTQLTMDGWDTPAGMRTARLIDVSTDEMGDMDDDEIRAFIRAHTVPMRGDGDFRSEESIALLKEADIVVTNPPFSLFREFIAQLEEYDKKFLIIGNMNAITYKECFPMIRDNRMWLGVTIHSGDREFRVPDSYECRSASFRMDEDGRKYVRVSGVRWFTNLDHDSRHEPLALGRHYTAEEYPKYDNYDAINVDSTKDIPIDYVPSEKVFATKEEAERFAEECRAKGIYATVEEI